MMETPVLKRRLNPFLLASTVLVLALLAGLSVMYQGQLSDILSEKRGLQDNLEQKNARIDTLEKRVSNLTNETTVLRQDVQKYVSRSENLESEVETLNSKIRSLEDDKDELEDRISALESENKELGGTIEDINGTLEIICSDSNSTIEDGDEKCNRWGHNFEGDEP